jgi:glutaredoxin
MIGLSWCKSEGCEVSKSLLNIEQTDLYSLAIIAFGVLLLVGLKIIKTDSVRLKEFFRFSILVIMLCETILLSYLYFKSGTLCISCFIFYLLVISNYLLLNLKSKNIFVIPFLIACMAVLDLNVNTTSNDSITSKYTLLQSESCEHCKKVKTYLKENSITYKKEDYAKYSGLFSSLNITKIPVLIVKNNENNLLILNGVSEITNHFTTTNNSKKLPINIDTYTENKGFSFSEPKEGCEVDFLKKDLENCEE